MSVFMPLQGLFLRNHIHHTFLQNGKKRYAGVPRIALSNPQKGILPPWYPFVGLANIPEKGYNIPVA